jgi:GTPase SAR1 family protein
MKQTFSPVWTKDANIFNNAEYLPSSLRMIITGPASCGKTCLLQRMLLEEGILDYDKLYIYTPTIDQIGYQILIKGFKNNLSKEMIRQFYNDQNEITDLDEAIEVIKNRISNKNPVIEVFPFTNGADLILPEKLDKKSKNLCIFDDCCFEKEIALENYFTRGRHSNINMIYLTQSYFELPRRSIRNNSNLLIFLMQNSIEIQNLWVDKCKADFPDLNHFKEACENLWKDKYDRTHRE